MTDEEAFASWLIGNAIVVITADVVAQYELETGRVATLGGEL